MDSSKQSETGWVVEDANSAPHSPLYFGGFKNGQFTIWTNEHMQAVRFSRKEDAEKLDVGKPVRVAEHAWN